MKYPEERMIKIAKLYYEENYTQQEISRKLNISRQTVGRILNEALKEGIVTIKVADLNRDSYQKQELQLQEKFELDEVIIVPAYDTDAATIRKMLGKKAAHIIHNRLKYGQTLACSWGRTLLEVVHSMEPANKNIDVVQLNGALDQKFLDINSSELARMLAQKLGGNSYHLHAPGIVDNKNIRNTLIEDGSIKSVLKKAKNADLAAIGIGSLQDSPLYKLDFFSQQQLNKLVEKDVSGDLCLRFIDKEGQPVRTSFDDRVIGITLEELKEIDYVIGIAGGGNNKVEAILAALKGKYLDVLITDSHTSSLLIKKIK